MNTGDGALSPFHLEGGADIVFQIGTAKYGVRDERGKLSDGKLREIAAHEQVKMFEIKMRQGAKLGKGGILPGNKVTSEITEIRGIPEGIASISPIRYPEVDSVADLLDLIARIKKVTGKPVGFKCVIGDYGWLAFLFDEILSQGLKSAPDFINNDSVDGGIAAAPMSQIDYIDMPIWDSLPLVIDRLVAYELKDRIKIIAFGKLITPADVAWALCVGADLVVSARVHDGAGLHLGIAMQHEYLPNRYYQT